jgi:hypothetical protein
MGKKRQPVVGISAFISVHPRFLPIFRKFLVEPPALTVY